MWNEEKGFGFVTPSGDGEDVFVHRSSLGEGVVLAPGNAVTYEGVWDDRKGKYRAAGVALDASRPDSTVGSAGGGGGGRHADGGAPMSSRTPAIERARGHYIVGSFANWAIQRDPMAEDSEGGLARNRVVVRTDAPQAKGDSKLKREEFQILSDGDWNKRLYPSGGDKEEVVVLRPGDSGSPAASDKGKGHGRNWAVEGRAGAAFDVIYDPAERSVSCELAFTEGAGQR